MKGWFLGKEVTAASCPRRCPGLGGPAPRVLEVGRVWVRGPGQLLPSRTTPRPWPLQSLPWKDPPILNRPQGQLCPR